MAGRPLRRARRDASKQRHYVYDYDTGRRLEGKVSANLLYESNRAEPTGAVPAYRDEHGIWHFVRPSEVNHYRRNLREDVRTVYVD